MNEHLFLQKLSLLNFKNYDELSLEFSAKINCIVGHNGVGKTNIMDAIYYLSFCKSNFNPADSQNIKHDQEFFSIQGEFIKDHRTEKVFCGIKRRQKKKFSRNKKDYERLADHIGLFPLVMISPTDGELITEGGEVRRKLVDGIISQFNSQYLDHLINYNKALTQRNALLKQFAQRGNFDSGSLELWNMQLISNGEKIHESRKHFIEEFLPYFQKYYEMIGNSDENVGLSYDSQLNEKAADVLLEENLEKDRRFQHTTTGIHRDDMQFDLNDYPVKKYGSQGQQKSYLLALKLGQTAFIRDKLGLNPILLLDDIYDKLDEERVQRLADIISSSDFGQSFISDAHPKRSLCLFEDSLSDVKCFSIDQKSNVNEEFRRTAAEEVN